MITEDTILHVVGDLEVADLDGEAVILSPQTGTYYGLNEVGARAFELTERPLAIGELVDMLLQEFDVSREQLLTDLIRFFTDMEEANLVNLSEAVS